MRSKIGTNDKQFDDSGNGEYYYLKDIDSPDKLLEALNQREREKTTTWLTKKIVISCLAALILAAIISLIIRNYTPIVAIWAIIWPILGIILGYYYPGYRKTNGKISNTT